MELDKRIEVTAVEDTATFQRSGQVTPQTRYTYFVGGHGPFSLVFERGTDTQEVVHKAMTDKLNALEGLGIVKRT